MIFLKRKMDLPNYSNYGQDARLVRKVNKLPDCGFFTERIHNPIQFLSAIDLWFLKSEQPRSVLMHVSGLYAMTPASTT